MKLLKNINIDLTPAPTPYEWSIDKAGIFDDCIHLIGFEFDGTACFRKGTKSGPNALRAVSDGIESYSPYLDSDLDGVSFVDLGNLNLGTAVDTSLDEDTVHQQIEAQWHKGTNDFCALFGDVDLKQSGAKVLTLGGEHSISYAPLKTYLEQFDDLLVIHLDAHADLRDGYLGFHYSHAAIMRRALDHFGEGHELVQYGIRSGTGDEYQWMRDNKTLMTDRQSFLEKIASVDDKRPIYLTFDLDYFDPSYFPGTGTPEPGGEDFHSFVSLCKILRAKNFVGCDVVELSPVIDQTGNSDVFATKVVRELLLCMSDKAK